MDKFKKGGDVSIANVLAKSELLVRNNSTTLLTGVGVLGTISTAVLTGRASFRAANIIHNEVIDRCENSVDRLNRDQSANIDTLEPTFKEKLEMVWPQFIPPVGVGVLTVAAIITANRLSAKEAAALATAYGISEKALQEYREKVVERLGEGKEQKIRDEIAQDRVNNTHDSKTPIVVPGSGEVLCLDLWTGRYFQSTVEKIRKAENDVNYEIVAGMYASASQFYDSLGLEATEMTDLLGWNINNRLEVQISTAMAPDSTPCVTISPTPPVPNYNQLY